MDSKALGRVEVNISRGRDFAGKRPMNAHNNAFQNPPCRFYLFAWGDPRLKPVHWFVDGVEECVTDNGHNLAAGTYAVLACGFNNSTPQDYDGTLSVQVAPKSASPWGRLGWWLAVTWSLRERRTTRSA